MGHELPLRRQHWTAGFWLLAMLRYARPWLGWRPRPEVAPRRRRTKWDGSVRAMGEADPVVWLGALSDADLSHLLVKATR